jgi:hypothetical protein
MSRRGPYSSIYISCEVHTLARYAELKENISRNIINNGVEIKLQSETNCVPISLLIFKSTILKHYQKKVLTSIHFFKFKF